MNAVLLAELVSVMENFTPASQDSIYIPLDDAIPEDFMALSSFEHKTKLRAEIVNGVYMENFVAILKDIGDKDAADFWISKYGNIEIFEHPEGHIKFLKIAKHNAANLRRIK